MLTTLILSLTLLLSFGRTTANAETAAPKQQAGGPADPGELSEWLDPVIEQNMAKAHIPGAVLVVVKDGKVFYSKGYGLADVATNQPVDPEHSVWRVMSISKPVTALAVMQLVEQGKIDLNVDVNQYLKHFQLPATFPQPVTAGQLLTHSAGLDWDLDDIGTAASTPDGLIGLSSFLAKQPPVRIFPPGREYLYSNGAYDILGAMVEDVSGLPFADYVQQHVFNPLGMADSTFVQPPATENLVTSYKFEGTDLQPASLPLWQNPPSRAMTASAPDMARLIAALVSDGAPVLQPATLAKMLGTHFSYQPDGNGLAYGFGKSTWASMNLLLKDGSAEGAFSQMLLLPEQKLGLFLAYNLNDDSAFAGDVTNQFLQHYYPGQGQVPPPAAAGSAERGQALAGIYRQFTYSHHTISKLLRLQWPDFPEVTSQADEHLAARFGPEADAVADLVEVAPLHYRTADGLLDYVFTQDNAGKVTGFNIDEFVVKRVAWYDTQRAQNLALIGFLLVFLAGALVWPLVLLVRRRQGRPVLVQPLARRAAWLLTAVAAMSVILILLLLVLLQNAGTSYLYGMPPTTAAVVAGLQLTSLLTLALVVVFLFLWRRRALPLTGLVLYGLFTLVALAFIPWLNYWNLIGFKW